MTEKLMRDAVNELNKIKQILAAMNVNHAEIGKLVQSWLKVEEPVELEIVDREAFVIGQAVRCTDISMSSYKHIGTIKAISGGPVLVEFQHLVAEGRGPVGLHPNQIEILPQPKLKIGDKVRVIDPHSLAYKEIGEVENIASMSQGVDVKFPSGSGGAFDRRNLELVEAYETELEIDDIVRVTEPGSVAYDHVGTIIGFRKDGTIRVLFADKKGYQIFIESELTKIGEQPYKEKN